MEPNKAAYRTVKLIGLLLILEVVALVAIGSFEFFQIRWGGLNLEGARHDEVERALYALFIPSGILTLMSAFSFLFMRRRGWLLAAIAQALSLAVSLWLYSWFQPTYIYPIMAYCVLMILFLNSHDVRVVFLSRQDSGASVEG
ncbi:MAG TPA: hypothetical protein VFY59_12885 [Rubrobacter sp.]|jgi:hypothetical protein|nr:hypothetical protein [Rubrobacter sp.]